MVFALIFGGSGSGKSEYAEKLSCELAQKNEKYYIATMIPKTEDNYERIEKHKKQRSGLRFTTLELPYSLNEEIIEPDSAVLLEDVSNLLANNIFDKNKNADEVFDDLINELEKLDI